MLGLVGSIQVGSLDFLQLLESILLHPSAGVGKCNQTQGARKSEAVVSLDPDWL